MAAAYDDCNATHFDLHSPRLPEAAFQVDLTHGADRLVSRTFDLYDQRGEVFMLADENELRRTFDDTPIGLQRAALIAIDVDQVTCQYGATAPQTIFMRELYAVAAFDAASHGYRAPHLEPLVNVTGGEFAHR